MGSYLSTLSGVNNLFFTKGGDNSDENLIFAFIEPFFDVCFDVLKMFLLWEGDIFFHFTLSIKK